MTKRESILQAVLAALTGTSGVGTNIFRSRVTAIMKKDFPALVLEPVNDTAEPHTFARYSWALTFQVAVLVRSADVDTDADAIVEDAHQKIITAAQTAGQTLEGLLVNLIPTSVDWQFVEADITLTVVTMQFRATYQTDQNNI